MDHPTARSVSPAAVALCIITSIVIMVGILLAAPGLGIPSFAAQMIAFVAVIANIWAWVERAG